MGATSSLFLEALAAGTLYSDSPRSFGNTMVYYRRADGVTLGGSSTRQPRGYTTFTYHYQEEGATKKSTWGAREQDKTSDPAKGGTVVYAQVEMMHAGLHPHSLGRLPLMVDGTSEVTRGRLQTLQYRFSRKNGRQGTYSSISKGGPFSLNNPTT